MYHVMHTTFMSCVCTLQRQNLCIAPFTTHIRQPESTIHTHTKTTENARTEARFSPCYRWRKKTRFLASRIVASVYVWVLLVTRCNRKRVDDSSLPRQKIIITSTKRIIILTILSYMCECVRLCVYWVCIFWIIASRSRSLSRRSFGVSHISLHSLLPWALSVYPSSIYLYN